MAYLFLYISSTQSYQHKMKRSFFTGFLLLSCIMLISTKTFAQGNNGNATTTDTLIYKASAYAIQPNDKLDDLLKRLLLVNFDNKGKIYVQGDLIERLFVDGDEFYSDSPTIAARVLRADKVDVIKIYWRLADQSSFTGIAEKVRQKVINVILKKEKG